MEPPGDPQPSARGTFLTILLLALCGLGCLVFAIGLMGPFVLTFFAIVGVMGFIGLCHYLLWGRSMSDEVMIEREEGISDEPDSWRQDGPHRPGRM